MEEKIKSNKKIIASIIIVLILLMLIGGSYAAYRYNFLGVNNLIDTESIELEFLESSGEIIDIPNAFPMIDSAGIAQEETFDFQVKTKTKREMNITYGLYIEKMEPDTDYTFLDDSEVKVYLTDFSNNQKLAPTKVSELDEYMLYSETNSHSSTSIEQKDKYKLRIWIDEDVTAKDWDENTKLQYKFKIGVRAEEGGSTGSENTAVTMLIDKVGESGLEEVTHTADSTLQIGATESLTEYRFRGGNDVVTNNYVYFNCTDINNQSSSTCELYRIIGVFPVDDGTGNIENRIKLIKAENYGNNYWNSKVTNNWAEPATLNTTFNTTYWGTINAKYQILVGDAKYYLGGYNTDPSIRTSVMYGYERKIDESDGGNYYYNTNPTNWIGKIALMYASDYGYGANSACSENTNLSDYDTNSCPDNNWLYLASDEWLLPQRSGNSGFAFYVRSSGYVVCSGHVVYDSRAVRPVLYLTANAKFNNIGDGSRDNPYQLKELSTSSESTSNAVYSWSTSDVSLGATKDSISGYTTDYTTLGKTFFLKHNIGSDNTVESQEVCYILNGTMYCLTGGDEGASYETNKETLFASFGEDNCSVDSSDVYCSASGLSAIANDDGNVGASDDIGECDVNNFGSANCFEL